MPLTQAAGTDILTRTAGVIADHIGLEGSLLPILHAVQHEFGYVPSQSLPLIADALNISRAEVYGVVTFYHDYRSKPAGTHVFKVCQAEACQSMGSDRIAGQLKQALGIGFHETTLDGSVTLEPVYCLGLCACAPSAMLDGAPIGRLDADMIAEIVAEIRP
ncbi:formate dehydrogenase subunit gamma [Mesorhizobium sp. WSM2239]|uniref:Formate dehydrogenase subunit gamma n=2 Tax=unclassified Mesorhizobium TaxID=325217 RepID=A0AAU8DID0_9HYPH